MKKVFCGSLVFTIISLGLLGGLFCLDYYDLLSRLEISKEVDLREWLGFCANIVGSMIGAGLAAVFATGVALAGQKKENENQKELSRKNVLPLIKVKRDNASLRAKNDSGIIDGYIELAKGDEKPLIIKLGFSNVGFREMYNVWVGGINFGEGERMHYCKISSVIHKGDEYEGIVAGSIKEKYKKEKIRVFFNIYYCDCYDNWYVQEICGESKRDETISQLDIRKAPERVDARKLPEDIIERRDVRAGK